MKVVVKKNINRGFVLIELLTVIAVLSVLIITSYLAIPKQIKKAQDARRKADLHRTRTLLNDYYNLAESFPKELPDCGQPLDYKGEKVIPAMPCDPTTKEPYYYQVKSETPQNFRLYANLANEDDFSIEDVGCGGGCGPDCVYNYGISSSNVDLIRCSYVCAPGGGGEGSCELYENFERSECPQIFGKDDTCENACDDPANRCQNASGKNVPF